MNEEYFPSLTVSALRFSDGSVIDVSESSVVLFVGPNNSGKSRGLKDIFGGISRGARSDNLVVNGVSFRAEDTLKEIISWLRQQSKPGPYSSSHAPFIGSYDESAIQRDWDQRHKLGLGDLAKALVLHLTTEERLKAADPCEAIDIASNVETHPLHSLFIDEQLTAQIDEIFHESFSEHLVLNREAGKVIRLHVAPTWDDLKSLDVRSRLRKINAYPVLQAQGDGMRSFVGILISILAAKRRIMLLDEPEAFLHPPQATALGQLLAQRLPEGRQLFVATHSTDLLKGILDKNSKNVLVVRITREGCLNKTSVLSPNQVKAVWSDPLLRYSRVLEGLFHDGVIVCEGDTDCRFYSAIIEAIATRTTRSLMFVHGGGVGKIAEIVKALRAVQVPVRAVADFDVLSDLTTLQKIVAAFGGNWNEMAVDYDNTIKAIEKVRAQKSVDDVKSEVVAIFDSVKGHNLSQHDVEDIKRAVKLGSGWVEAKRLGRGYITSSDGLKAYDSLDDKLKTLGLFIVPVGEVEGFNRYVDGKGPKWALEALQLNLNDDNKLESARRFCFGLIANWSV